MYDGHMHTPLCKHAFGEPEEYARRALERGMKGITFTCHSPMPKGWWTRVRMDDEEFVDYVGMVERAAKVFDGQLEIRLGIESDWFPGMEGWLEKLHQRVPMSHVLGSVHFFGPEYMQRFFHQDVTAFQRQYFDHVAESAESGLFDTLAHPDLVKNFHHDCWNLEVIQEEVESALDRIAKTGVAMELNTSGIHKNSGEMNPGPEILRLMSARKIPVVIGSDSHVPSRVGEGFEAAFDSLESAGYSEVSWFIDRTRHTGTIAALRKSLKPELAPQGV